MTEQKQKYIVKLTNSQIQNFNKMEQIKRIFAVKIKSVYANSIFQS